MREHDEADALPLAADTDPPAPDEGGGGAGAGVAEPPPPPAEPKKKPKGDTKKKPKRNPPEMLPPWKVLLHNDDVNFASDVVEAIVELTPLDVDQAIQRTLEADATDVALLLVTHKERAELYVEQFRTKTITVSIEPAE